MKESWRKEAAIRSVRFGAESIKKDSLVSRRKVGTWSVRNLGRI